jgi:pyruvate dehydrogenase E1 component
VILRWAFSHLQAPDGSSVYLRLSTRTIEQAPRTDASFHEDLLQGAYWQVPPARGARLALAYVGAVAPEVVAAHIALREDVPGLGLLAVPSPDLAHAAWAASLRAPWLNGPRPHTPSHIERLLSELAPDASLVTVLDGSPQALSWLGSVRGQRVVPLGIERFGQSGTIDALYRAYRIGADAILDACASALLPRAEAP